MKLISVERLDLLDCLTRTVDMYPKACNFYQQKGKILNIRVLGYKWALNRSFWTSGTNKDCANVFNWCSSQKIDTKELRWSSGHPNFSEANCVSITLQANITGLNSTLETSQCSEKKQFICEVLSCYNCCLLATELYTQKTRRGSDTLQKNLECAEIWKISDAQAQSVQKLNFNPATASKAIKVCNLKIGSSKKILTK
jgi:hypothetical protein